MAHAPKLRYVDPYKRRGRVYLALCRFSATKAGAWLSVNVAWKVDPHLLKLTRGRFSTAAPLAAALLESRGARTGQPRRNAALYFHDGDRVTIVASLRGWPKNPAWYYNLRKHPDVVFGGLPFRAEIVEDQAERQRLWDLADRVYPQYADFREQAGKAGRVIPIVQLVPPVARCLRFLAVGGGRRSMSSVTCQISISLDGFVAGPNQSIGNPIGEGGMRLHQWAIETASWREQQGLEGGERGADSEVIDEVFEGVGAYIMGRKMFGGGEGPWDETWTGWWGDDPPYHAPVFVLTHHAREPLSMQGGTTFTFVTDGIESALEQARTAAGDQDVAIAGGASAVRQYLRAGALDELYLHIVPITLGAGERLLEDVGDPSLQPVKVIASPAVTHIKYRVARQLSS